MDISGVIKAIFAPDLEAPDQRPATLTAGDRLIGRVLEIRPNGLAVMDFGSFRALAEIGFQVTLGQHLPLEVIDTQETLKLRLLESPASASAETGNRLSLLGPAIQTLSSRIEELLAGINQQPGAERPLAPVLSALNQLNLFFKTMDLNQDLPQIMARLESLVQDGGLLFEKKLAEALAAEEASEAFAPSSGSPPGQALARIVKTDLKPNLLIARQFLDQLKDSGHIPDAKALADLKGAMDRLIEDIQQQTSTLKRSPDTEPLHAFFHYLPIFEKSRMAGLKVFYARKTKGAALRQPMVSLLLGMDRLGTIRSDFLLIENNLSITFYVQRPAVKKTLEAHADEIRSRLQGVVAHLNLKFIVSEKKIESFRTVNQSTASDGKVDVMA